VHHFKIYGACFQWFMRSNAVCCELLCFVVGSIFLLLFISTFYLYSSSFLSFALMQKKETKKKSRL
jgi:hypothetical protein